MENSYLKEYGNLNYKKSITDVSDYRKNDMEAGLKSYNKILKMGADEILKSNLT